MNIIYKIAIDRVNANYISGWCFHRLRRTRPVTLQWFRGDDCVAETEASRFREDLLKLGIHPTGRCGFELLPGLRVEGGATGTHTIRVKDTGIILAEVALDGGGQAARPGRVQRLKRLLTARRPATPPAIFMHIPKTAGTTFNTVAQAFYPDAAITHIELLPAAGYQSLPERCRYISGHLRYGLLARHFPPDRYPFYTLVREPYGQLHSHLSWLVQTGSDPQERYFKATNRAIHDLGRRLARRDFSSVAALRAFVASLSDLEAAFLDNLQTRYFLDQRPHRVSGADLDRALVNSGNFALIGVTEDYQSFVRSFRTRHGIRTSRGPAVMNRSSAPDLFDRHDKAVREALRPLVDIDLELYAALTAAAAGRH